MSLNVTASESMSSKRRIRCKCPCGYGFETCSSEDNAIVMVQAHFNKFHADMLPFGTTTVEARALLTTINNVRKTSSRIHPLYSSSSAPAPLNLDKELSQAKAKRKRTINSSQII
jgi:hypothetical protein